jgi:hypothetical protein
MLDACRLNFCTHRDTLKHLCSAFYDHVKKHAYYYIVHRVYDDFKFASFDHVRELFHMQLVRQWPADLEWGVPIMPHESRFRRDINLYVDFTDASQEWAGPDSDYAKSWVTADGLIKASRLLETTKVLEAVIKGESDGLYSPEILSIFNSVFQNDYFNENRNYDDLKRAYDQIARKISVACGFAEDKFSTHLWQCGQCTIFLR